MKKPQLITRIQVEIQIKIQRLKNTSFDDFKMFNERFSIIHEFLVRVAVILGLTTVFFFFLKEITTNKYILTNIEVAHSIEEGKDERIYHSDLRQKIIKEIKLITKRSETEDGSVANDANPINFGGFDLNQIFLYFRSFFNMQNREIRVYVDYTSKWFTDKSVIKKYETSISIGNEEPIEQKHSSEQQIAHFLAEQILLYNAPYKLGLHLIEVGDYDQLENITTHLQNLADKEHWWEKLFQNNNWTEKKKYLEMIAFCYNNKYLLNKSKIVNEPDEDACNCLYNDVIYVNEDSKKRAEKIKEDSLKHIQFVNDSIRLCNKTIADTVKKSIRTIREFKEKFKN